MSSSCKKREEELIHLTYKLNVASFTKLVLNQNGRATQARLTTILLIQNGRRKASARATQARLTTILLIQNGRRNTSYVDNNSTYSKWPTQASR